MSTTSLHYQVCYAKGQLDHSPADLSPSIDCLEDGLKSILLPITSQSPVVGSLDNDFTYGFKVRVVDNSNPKTVIVLTDTWSNIQTAVPFQIDSIAVLDNSGPNWAMDCSQGSTSPSAFAIWAFLGVILLAMRKRSSVFLLVALLTTPSFARFGQVSIGITGSPYRPNLNLSKTEKSGVTNPWYKCIFDDKLLPLMGLHVDMHLFDNFGSLRVGLGAAYAYASGFGVKHGSCDNKSGQSTAGVKTNVVAGMHMLHLRPQLTYVLDTWIDSFPVAPYVKAGLVGAGYYDTFQNKPDNPKALGMIFGWEAAAGLMLALDWIEPTVSGEARGLGTYDHTFLVFEAAYAPIDNFGNNGRNYSNAWLSKTVPLSLTASLVVEFQ
jgi:hypothetical protein